jgi:hypothetical protein
MDPKVASELSLRIPHLPLRMKEHSARAQRYAGASGAQPAMITGFLAWWLACAFLTGCLTGCLGV